MSEQPINWQEELKPFWAKTVKVSPHPMSALIEAINSADRIDDARVLTEIALSQVKEYESGSTLHKVVTLLQAIQGILEAETETLQWNLDKCQDALRGDR